ncbi:MAG: extracellular solute-binding protein [Solirubrobacteraceae bacterium]
MRHIGLRAPAVAGVCAAIMSAGIPAAQAVTGRHTHKALRHSGNVEVFSAGSLDTLMTRSIGPAFHAATGYTMVNTSESSGTIAADIRNKVVVADVFVSASPADDALLEGPKHGSWVSWYATFATSPYVLGYDPNSRFAKDLRTMPWYKVITMPGFRLGRTNPSQDPGGVLAVKALKETARAKHLPALTRLATETSDEYVEDSEQADIQNGQLDASFMFEADANSQKSPFVKLTGTHLLGDYTITIVHNAPHMPAAQAFVKFLLGAKGQAALRADKFGVVSPPKVSGNGVPAALSTVLR